MRQTGWFVAVIIAVVIVVIVAVIFVPLLLLWCLKALGAPVIVYSFKQWAAALFILTLLGGISRITVEMKHHAKH